MAQHPQQWGVESGRDLGSIDFHHPTALRGRTQLGLRNLVIQARAGLRRSSLNAALARGADPCESATLAYRAARLTSDRVRERLAASIDDVLDATARPARMISAKIEISRDEVRVAGPLLLQVVELLRSTAPLYCRGLAMLEELVRDAASPLYFPARRGALRHEVKLIIAALEGEQPRPGVARGGAVD